MRATLVGREILLLILFVATGFRSSNAMVVLKRLSLSRQSIRRAATALEPAAPAPRLWNVANILTASRVGMVPLLGVVWCAPMAPTSSRLARTGIFGLAAVTDLLDGYIARRWSLQSKFGAFLDPVADKLMVACTLALLSAEWGLIVALPASIILCREIGVSALREWMAELGERNTVAVDMLGKLKTCFQLLSLTMLLAADPPTTAAVASMPRWRFPAPGAGLGLVGICSLYIATALTFISGQRYLVSAWPTLTSESRELERDKKTADQS